MICGGGDSTGVVRNLAVRASAVGVDVSWAFDRTQEDEFDGVFAVALDGDLIAILPGEAREFSFSGVSAGRHRVDVVPFGPEDRPIPDLHGHDYGRRAWLTWGASTSTDCTRYFVFADGGTGTVDLDEEVAIVDRIAVRRGLMVESGDDVGRVSIEGVWTEGAINREFSIEVDGGRFRHDVPTGTMGEWGLFAGGGTYELDAGLRVRFEDESGAYAEGGTWSFRVGPVTEWGSGELAVGSHKFAIKAADAAGNLSSATAERSVAIIHLPNEVSGLAGSWDGEEITLGWTPPAGIAGIHVYANWSAMFEELTEYVFEDHPFEELAAAATSFTFTPEEAGVWRFYVRTVDASGRVSESAELVSVDATALPSAVALNEPERLRGEARAGGAVLLRWAYPWNGGEDLDTFAVYVHEDPEAPSFATASATVENPARSLSGYSEHELLLEDDIPTEAFGVTVRAVDADGNETVNGEVVIVTPDATAPNAASNLLGGPN